MSSLMTRHTGPAGREEDIRNDHQMGALAGSWPLSPGLHSLHLLRYCQWRVAGREDPISSPTAGIASHQLESLNILCTKKICP